MQNPEQISPTSTAPTDVEGTLKGAAIVALFLLVAPVYLAVFFGFCGLAARAFHYAGSQIGF